MWLASWKHVVLVLWMIHHRICYGNGESRDLYYRIKSPCSLLELNNERGRVIIKAWEKQHIKICVHKYGAYSARQLAKLSVHMRKTGDTLLVESIWRASRRNSDTAHVEYFIRIPTHLDTRVTMQSGSIKLCGARGTHTLRTSNGTVIGKHLGDVDAITSNGEIVLEDVRNVTAQTSHAWLVVNGARNTHVSTPQVGIVLKAIRGYWQAETNCGPISVEHSAGSGTAQTLCGDIVVKDCVGINTVSTCRGNIEIVNSQHTTGNTLNGEVVKSGELERLPSLEASRSFILTN
ncbi:hypothetical protein KJZ61_01830 [Candidatus Dependentiae bacterium]|nr:hypothetical protein [Candidatus Dependentiae bacterium]